MSIISFRREECGQASYGTKSFCPQNNLSYLQEGHSSLGLQQFDLHQGKPHCN